MTRIVVPLVSEAYRDPVAGERPKFLDEPLIEFTGPFAAEERHDLVSSVNEFGSVPPS